MYYTATVAEDIAAAPLLLLAICS